VTPPERRWSLGVHVFRNPIWLFGFLFGFIMLTVHCILLGTLLYFKPIYTSPYPHSGVCIYKLSMRLFAQQLALGPWHPAFIRLLALVRVVAYWLGHVERSDACASNLVTAHW
jgi:hypothetical protein